MPGRLKGLCAVALVAVCVALAGALTRVGYSNDSAFE